MNIKHIKLLVPFFFVFLIAGTFTQKTQAQTQNLPCGGADLNVDGIVNIFDFIILSQDYGHQGSNLSGDINGDNVVNIFDFIILSQNFLTSCTHTTPTPTPNSSPTPSPTPVGTPSPLTCGANGDVTFEFTYDGNPWTDGNPGYCTEILITNNTNTVLPTWTMIFDLQDTLIGNISWGNYTQTGTTFSVTPKKWVNDNIPPGETRIAAGFCAYLNTNPSLQYPQFSCSAQ